MHCPGSIFTCKTLHCTAIIFTRLAKCDITESLLVMLIQLMLFCLIRPSFGVKNVCFKCNRTETEKLGRIRVLNGVPSLNLQHGQEVALCHNETGHARVLCSDQWWSVLDPGYRVECDDQYYLCYSAMLVCETKQWETEANKEEVSLWLVQTPNTLFSLATQAGGVAQAGEASPKAFYMRGCAKKPVFGLTQDNVWRVSLNV